MNIDFKKWLILAGKVGTGSALAILTAQLFHLPNSTAAGTVALLTLINTRRDTLKLVFTRIVTFFITTFLCLVIYPMFSSQFLSFGLVTFALVMITQACQWENTLSVNALINMHFFLNTDHDMNFIANEFGLVLIGIAIAFIFNQFYNYEAMEKDLRSKEELCDLKVRGILYQISRFLKNEDEGEVWNQTVSLQMEINGWIQEAKEYHDNRLHPDSDYFLEYFKMRQKQTVILNSLHRSMTEIRHIPSQAETVCGVIENAAGRVLVRDHPTQQLKQLEQVFMQMEQEQLPASRKEFESRAVLYHILLDLKELINDKEAFFAALSPLQQQAYFRQSIYRKPGKDHR